MLKCSRKVKEYLINKNIIIQLNERSRNYVKVKSFKS